MARKTCDRKYEPGRVRHTRAIQRDRTKRPMAAPPDEQIQQRLSDLLQPAIAAQAPYLRPLGLRDRVLTLSVMVAVVVSMLWRQLGSGGSDVARLLRTEGLLWVPRLKVSQQAVSQRLRVFPAVLLLSILNHLLPTLQARWAARRRPLPPVLAWAQEQYEAVLAVDGSTLDVVSRKVGLLRGRERYPLAGKMVALLNVCSWLPAAFWFHEDATTHDQHFWPQILQTVPKGALLLFDLGFTNLRAFAQAQFTFVTRFKRKVSFHAQRVVYRSADIQDRVGVLGAGPDPQQVRVVRVRYQGTWYSFLSNELDPEVLPTSHIVALYFQRWRIEDAFNIVKRILGLAYFWTGSREGIDLQVWATWLVYVILVDLTDDVAQALDRPFVRLSVEMVHRGLYYFAQAYRCGAAQDPVTYLAENAHWLGLVKRHRKRSDYRFLSLTNPGAP